MLKYANLIEKLSFKQKAALLTDISLTEDIKYTRLGIPQIRIVELEPLLALGQDTLTLSALARSFDAKGIEDTVHALLSAGGGCEGTIYTIPAPKPYMFGASSRSVSEDTCLSAEVLAAAARGIKRAGGAVMLDGFWLTQFEADTLDIIPDMRALKETVVAPAGQALLLGGCDALGVSSARLTGEYENVNRTLATVESEKITPKGVRRLTYARTVDDTLLAVSEGILLIKGVVSAVENAHIKYERMKAAVDSGQYTAYALEEAVAGGEALSDEVVDAALDSLLDFIFECQGRVAQIPPADAHTAMREAIARCAVVLKNEGGGLPLSRVGRVAVIGDAVHALGREDLFIPALKRGLNTETLTACRGYDMAEQRGDALFEEALRLAQEADTVLLFLTDSPLEAGFDRTLPANQISLLEALSKYRERLTVILACDTGVDMSFDKYTDRLVLHSVGGAQSAEALAEVLLGVRYPTGRLSKTFYYRPDEYRRDIKKHKERGYTRLGVFTDYKLYGDDTEIGYPFGYGLSYCEATYSNITTDKGSVELDITSDCEIPCDRVVQIYFSKPDSAIARPKRELKGIAMVRLTPGQTTHVSIAHAPLEVYDDRTDNLFVENGEHTVEVCESCQDVRLTATQFYNGWRLSHSGAVISDYLQNESNIRDKNFYLEARSANMKVFKRTQIIAAGAFALALALAVSAVLMLSLGVGFTVLMAILALSAAGGGAYMQLRALKQRRFYLLEKSDRTPLLFEDAKVARVRTVDELFDDEFEAKAEGAAELDTDVEHAIRILRDISVDELAVFRDYAKERGVELDREDALAIVSSLLSSRLIISRTLSGEKLSALVSVLAEFLDATVSSENIDENYDLNKKLIAPTVLDDEELKGAVARAVDEAIAEPDRAHIVFLTGLNAIRAQAVLTPYVRYFSSPKSALTVTTEDKEHSVTMPENIWFICELDSAEPVDAVAHYLNESAVLLTAEDLLIKERAAELTVESDVVYGTLEPLAKRLASNLAENEELFKRIDRLEEYVSQRTPYSIGNRFWIRIETYLATLLSVGTELRRATDLTLSCVILPTLMSVVRGKLLDDERTMIEETERVFGEEGTEVVRRLLS